MRDQVRRNMPLFSMAIVTKLTELTPRQIRYYEQQKLIFPSRTKGNHRLFSFNDVDRLLQIKSLLEKGLNIAGVKEMLQKNEELQRTKSQMEKSEKEISERELRQILKRQLVVSRPGQAHLIQGDLSRFFRH